MLLAPRAVRPRARGSGPGRRLAREAQRVRLLQQYSLTDFRGSRVPQRVVIRHPGAGGNGRRRRTSPCMRTSETPCRRYRPLTRRPGAVGPRGRLGPRQSGAVRRGRVSHLASRTFGQSEPWPVVPACLMGRLVARNRDCQHPPRHDTGSAHSRGSGHVGWREHRDLRRVGARSPSWYGLARDGHGSQRHGSRN